MTRDRRWGIAVLLAAGLALLVVTRLSGPDLPGEAVAVPLVPVPAVGACVDTRGNEPVVVDCAQRHTATVYQSWRTGSAPADISDRCAGGQGVSIAWSDAGPPDWVVPTVSPISVEVATTSPVGWQACVFVAVADQDPTRPLSYRGSGEVAQRPGLLQTGNCFVSEQPEVRQQQLDCARPHTIERIGAFYPMGRSLPVTTCAEFARRQVGAAAFRGPNALLAVTGVDRSQGSITVHIAPGESTTIDPRADEGAPVQTCSIVSQQPLVDSVLGLGDKPLPFG